MREETLDHKDPLDSQMNAYRADQQSDPRRRTWEKDTQSQNSENDGGGANWGMLDQQMQEEEEQGDEADNVNGDISSSTLSENEIGTENYARYSKLTPGEKRKARELFKNEFNMNSNYVELHSAKSSKKSKSNCMSWNCLKTTEKSPKIAKSQS